MKNLYLAKSKDKDGKYETIQEHTDKLLENLELLKKLYPDISNLNWFLLKIACIYHDLGKINTKFQNRIYQRIKDLFPEIEEIHHGYLSPAFLPKKYLKTIFTDDELKVLYQSIYYHHSRDELKSKTELQKIVNEDLALYLDDFEYDKMLPIEKLYGSYGKYVNTRIDDSFGDLFSQYIMTKGLLNRIDYSSSAHMDVELEGDNLFEKTEYSMKKYGFELNDLQKYLVNHRDCNNIIIASTGIGKTEASLLWIGNGKGFFTLPLKVCINAIYDRVVDDSKIGFDKNKTGLLHSDAISELLARTTDSGDSDIEKHKKAKQFSMPLTLCTLDQLVDFIFKYDGFELKLATLGYSRLIIDEIQMYSPELLGYLLLALKYIDSVGGKFTIVTATLPTIVLDFLDELGVKYNLPAEPFIKKDPTTKTEQVRHRIKVKNKVLNSVDVLKDDYQNKKILVIANTVKQAQKLYGELRKKLPKDYNLNLLHSRFIKKDRKEKERAILHMGKLGNDIPGIWVTTQIVEASLDIDFDILYTELSEVSGLFQRMGRVYRNRQLDIDTPNIIIYAGDDKNFPSGIKNDDRMSIVDINIFNLSKKSLNEFDNKILYEIDKMKIVEEVYHKKNIEHTNYYRRIKEAIEYARTIKAYEMDKKDIRLRDICAETFIPVGVFKDNEEEIRQLEETIKTSKSKKDRELARTALYDFTVSWECYQTMKAECDEAIVLSKYEKIRVLNFEYSKEMGLIKRML